MEGQEFDVSKRTIAATKLPDGDKVVAVKAAGEDAHLVFQTKGGFLLRILQSEIPVKKKAALGVRGIRLSAGDEVTEVHFLDPHTACEAEINGRMVSLNRLKIGNRDTKGTKVRN